MRCCGGLALACALGTASALQAQSTLGHSPNIRTAWTLAPGQGAFSFSHRFEVISGGDELLNLPTFSLGFGLPWRIQAGLDFTTNSEIVPTKLGGNEAQFWLGASVLRSTRAGAEVVAGYNTAAGSVDAAVTGRVTLGPVSLLAEARGFSDVFQTGESGAGGALGAVLRLTPYLELSGDAGRMLSPDSLSTVWSVGLAMAIPGSPHTLSLQATNGGAGTLQGATRPKILGPEEVRYGFVFTLPLGSGRQWGRIFKGEPASSPATGDTARVELRLIAINPRELRIKAGQAVVWHNRDPVAHTVTFDAGGSDSGELKEGTRFVQVFTRPGRYSYHCNPHPQMTGVVIVE
jgi:plastocyanin